MNHTEQKIETKEINDVTIQINGSKKRIRMEFPTSEGMGSILFYKQTSTTFQYKLTIGKEVKFSAQKPLWKIGLNNHCPLFKRLNGAFERLKIHPHFEDTNPKENMDLFIQQIQLVEYELKHPFERWEEEEIKTKSWAEFRNEKETFTLDKKKESMDILKDKKFLNYAVETIDQIAVAQKPKSTLCFLIALSFYPRTAIK